jgi:methylated-DNA-[protein]-cysteine S-methyltransferase
MTYFHSFFASPVGNWTLIASDAGLRAVLPPTDSSGRVPLPPNMEDGEHPILHETIAQLSKYFDGELQEFSLPIDLSGTPFQLQVWQELQNIPFGETCSYGMLAQRIDSPAAVRAVGAANGRNPISIVVPCHRVIGANGDLTGYAGGFPCKHWLLNFEKQQNPQSTLQAQLALFD